MESTVENLGRNLLEGRKVNQIRLEEIKQLWNRRKGDYFTRSRRDHAPSRYVREDGGTYRRKRRRRRTSKGSESVSELFDRALLLIEKNYALLRGGPAMESEESEPELDSEPLMAQGSSNPQQWGIHQVTQISSEIAEEKDTGEEDDDRGSKRSISSISYIVTEIGTSYTVTEIETHMEGDLKATREIPEEERRFQAAHLVETEVEGDGGDVSNLSEMKTEKEEDHLQGEGGRRSNDDRFVGGSGFSKGNDGRFEGGGRGSWVETMIDGEGVRPPELGASMEKGGSSTKAEVGVPFVPAKRLPPEPPDLDMPKAEVESSSGVAELLLSEPPSEPPDRDVLMQKGWTRQRLPPPEHVPVEKGTPPTLRLPPPVPLYQNPSMAEVGSAHGMVELPLLLAAEMKLGKEKQDMERARKELQRSSPCSTLMGQAQKCSFKRISAAEGGPSCFLKYTNGSQKVFQNKIVDQLSEKQVWALKEDKELTLTDTKNEALVWTSAFHGLLNFVYDRGRSYREIGEVDRAQLNEEKRAFEDGGIGLLKKQLVSTIGKDMFIFGDGHLQNFRLSSFLRRKNITCQLVACGKLKASIGALGDTKITSVLGASTKVLVAVFIADMVVHDVFGQVEHVAIALVHDQVCCPSDVVLQVLGGREKVCNGGISQWDLGGSSYTSVAWSSCFKEWNPGGVLDGTSLSSMKGNDTTRQYAALYLNHEAAVIFQELNFAKFARNRVRRGTKAWSLQDWLICNSEIKVGVKEWSFQPRHSKQWDPGGYYYASCISWSLCFQQWDPGGRVFAGCFLYLHLEDKVSLEEGSIDRDPDPRPIMTEPTITKV